MTDKHQMASILHEAYRANDVFPDSCHGVLSIEEAYQVQFELAELREADGDSIAGWKVGLTAEAMQIQRGMNEPCLGHLLQSGQVLSPAIFQFDELISPGFENELCFRLKAPLSGTNVSFEEAATAIGEVAPALEIIERRSGFSNDFPLAMAGNAQQKSFVTGAFISLSQGFDLSQVTATISVNGEVQETATGDKVLGNPINSLIWLAAKLAEYGRVIDAGAVVMSGSFTKQYSIAKGDIVHTQFEGIGVVEARF
ncbi:MAG: fumarylacetoacetate hydrolase family protein [Rhizobiaceae bacterium]